MRSRDGHRTLTVAIASIVIVAAGGSASHTTRAVPRAAPLAAQTEASRGWLELAPVRIAHDEGAVDSCPAATEPGTPDSSIDRAPNPEKRPAPVDRTKAKPTPAKRPAIV